MLAPFDISCGHIGSPSWHLLSWDKALQSLFRAQWFPKLHVWLRGHGGFASQKVASSRFGTDPVYNIRYIYIYLFIYLYMCRYLYLYTIIYTYMSLHNIYIYTIINIYIYIIQIDIYLSIYIYIYLCYACMHYDICIMCTIRIQMRVLQRFVQSGNCGKTSLRTAGCDRVNSSLRAKKRFADVCCVYWNGK